GAGQCARPRAPRSRCGARPRGVAVAHARDLESRGPSPPGRHDRRRHAVPARCAGRPARGSGPAGGAGLPAVRARDLGWPHRSGAAARPADRDGAAGRGAPLPGPGRGGRGAHCVPVADGAGAGIGQRRPGGRCHGSARYSPSRRRRARERTLARQPLDRGRDRAHRGTHAARPALGAALYRSAPNRGRRRCRGHVHLLPTEGGPAGPLGRSDQGRAPGSVARPPIAVDPADFPLETPVRTAPAHGFVAAASGARGLALLAPGFFEYEWTSRGDLLVTLLRAVGELSRGDLSTRPGHAGWPTSTPLAQCPGRTRVELAIAPVSEAELDRGDALPALWEDAFLPLRGFWLRDALDLAPTPV